MNKTHKLEIKGKHNKREYQHIQSISLFKKFSLRRAFVAEKVQLIDESTLSSLKHHTSS